MFKIKPDKKTVVISATLAILCVAIFVSTVMLCINGPRPIFADDGFADTVDSPACLKGTPDFGE